MEGRGVDDGRSPVIRGFLESRWTITASAVVACVLVLSACGGGSDSSGGGNSSSAKSASGASGANGSEPSAEFAGKGENGELATAGKESSVEEREAASKVVEEGFEARAAGDFKGQCETLAPLLLKNLKETAPNILQSGCVAVLEDRAEKAVEGALNNPMTGPLAALRVNGKLAFAFFHGAGGKNYVVPMEKRGTEWKVAALTTQETP